MSDWQTINTEFFVECDPVAFQRVRVNTRTGRFYNSKEYTQAKEEIEREAIMALAIAGEREFEIPNCDPVEIYLRVFLSKPKKRSGKYKNCDGAGRGDMDNFLKTVMDALEGVFYLNDGQVCHAAVWKMYVSDENPFPGLGIGVINFKKIK